MRCSGQRGGSEGSAARGLLQALRLLASLVRLHRHPICRRLRRLFLNEALAVPQTAHRTPLGRPVSVRAARGAVHAMQSG